MDFTVNRADLVRELNLARGAVERKTTMPILQHVLLEASGDLVTIVATDLEIGVRCPCPARVKKSGSVAVPAARLFDYVRLLPDGDVRLQLKANERVEVTSGRSAARIAGMAPEAFPELPSLSATIAEIPLGVLAAMIARTDFAISSEASRFTLAGALLLWDSTAATMVATDGHRLAIVRSATGSQQTELLPKVVVPRRALMEITKLAAEGDEEAPVRFARAPNHLFFGVGPRLLVARELTGNFPDYERLVSKAYAHSVVVDRAELASALQRVALFSDERSRRVTFDVGPAGLRVHAATDIAESEESLTVDAGSSALTIGFNAGYLLDFLKSIANEKVTFAFTDGTAAGEFRPVSEKSDEYRYIVMPMNA